MTGLPVRHLSHEVLEILSWLLMLVVAGLFGLAHLLVTSNRRPRT